MWNEKKSVFLSTVLVWIVFAALIISAVAAPFAVQRVAKLVADGTGELVLVFVTIYLSIVFGFLACLRLNVLLGNIKKGEVFVEANAVTLRQLSWLCFGVALLYLIAGCFWPSALLIFFAAGFFGLLLRIIKNVFEAAIVLREENEGTI